MDGRAVSRRRRHLTVLVGAPVLIVALGLTAVEAWRVVRPRSSLFTAPFAFSLAEAIETGNLQHAYQYIQAGQDPNALIAVRHPILTEGRWVLTSPLLWSVALGNVYMVKMLLGYGTRLDRAADRQAVCLAEALGHRDIVRVLSTYGEPQDRSCGQLRSTEPALLKTLAGSASVGR
jgi:hypothetical protein